MSRNGLTKDVEHEEARRLYQEGMTYNAIAARLGVAKSSLSLWCRDLAEVRRASKAIVVRVRKEKVVRVRKETKEKVIRERLARLAEPPYQDYVLYEYEFRDGLVRVQLVHRSTNQHVSLARARYNMAVHLGRVLEHRELVRRISNDLQDDRVENLKIVQRGSSRDFKPVMRICKTCSTEYQASRDLRRYCSPQCRVSQPVRTPTEKRLTNECVICEKLFETRTKADVCSPKCRGVLVRLLFQNRE